MRIDLALKRLLLVASRTEGKEACDVGSVFLNEKTAKASAEVEVGDIIRVEYAKRTLEIELLDVIGKNVSRAAARQLYRVIRDEPVA
ncbi:MAG: RNA-binding S4 domain-containing protein [Anaerolineae bacterium]|nr:RNA-binding S4 domain-containing protein [Gemmatimonadaceae bacterium]